MARKLAPAVALAGMALSATVLALGLGDINTRSALNQNFNADVELLSVDPAELDGLRVRLASPEAFQRAGIDRPFFLSGLKFTPMLRDDGKAVIQVRSDQPIREPFLNFLLELNWPQGRLVREYTVLLDPPATLQRRPAAVARPQAAPRAAAPAAPAPASAPFTAATLPDQYGPVQRGDTLWSIASQLRMDGASLTQMLMALYKANEGSFINGDINRLKQGSILRVPGRDEVLALSRREADAAFRAEQDLSLAARAKPSAEPAAEAEGDTAAVTEGGAAAVADEAPELRIATPRPEGEGEAGAGDDAAVPETSDDLKNALLLAREDAETSRQAADNLRNELDAVEQQLADMQRLLSLKDEQLARLQAGVEEGAEEAVPPAAEEAVAEIGREVAEPAEGEAVPMEEAVTEEAVTEEAVTEEAVTEAVPAEEAVVEEAPLVGEEAPAEEAVTEEVPAAEPEVAPEPAAPAVEAEVAPQPPAIEAEPPAKKKGLLELITDNAGLAGIAAAVVVALLALLALLRRRGKSEEPAAAADESLEESILVEPGEGSDLESVMAGTEEPAGDETTMLSEFSPSEMDSLAEESSEVDPVSEADVYIAYGRYDQAEELLNQALQRDPQRLALKFKLLEVFYANRKIPAFTACAQELADAGQDGVDTEAWQRVLDMGRELAPDYPLFSAAASGVGDSLEDSIPDFEPSQPASIDPLSDFRDESILDIPGGQEAVEEQDKTKPVDAISESLGESETDLTLDLDDLSMPPSSSTDSQIEGLDSIDLELPNLDTETEKEKSATAGGEDSLLLDLDTELEESVASSELRGEELTADSLQAQLDELSDLTELDEELSHLTADFGGGASAPASEPAPQAEEPEIPSSLVPEAEDDVQTKLDLAIAYVEMGDKEGARSILEEVEAEGNDSQKGEARRLLDEMNG